MQKHCNETPDVAPTLSPISSVSNCSNSSLRLPRPLPSAIEHLHDPVRLLRGRPARSYTAFVNARADACLSKVTLPRGVAAGPNQLALVKHELLASVGQLGGELPRQYGASTTSELFLTVFRNSPWHTISIANDHIAGALQVCQLLKASVVNEPSKSSLSTSYAPLSQLFVTTKSLVALARHIETCQRVNALWLLLRQPPT